MNNFSNNRKYIRMHKTKQKKNEINGSVTQKSHTNLCLHFYFTHFKDCFSGITHIVSTIISTHTQKKEEIFL